MKIKHFYDASSKLTSLFYGVYVDYTIDTYPFQNCSGNLGMLSTTKIEEGEIYSIKFYYTNDSGLLIDYCGDGEPAVLFDLEYEWCDGIFTVILQNNITIFREEMSKNKFLCYMDNLNPYDYEPFPLEKGGYELVFKGNICYNLLNLKTR